VQLVAESHVFMGCLANHTWGEALGFRLMIDTCKAREDLVDLEAEALALIAELFHPERVNVYHLDRVCSVVRKTKKGEADI